MSFAAGLQHLRVDAATVVANRDPEPAQAVNDLGFNLARLGMAKRIRHGLTRDSDYFVANQRMNGSRRTLHDHPELGGFLSGELFAHSRQHPFQIMTVGLGAQHTNRIAAFFAHLLHQIENALHQRLRGRIEGQAVVGHIELHVSAEETL